MFCCLSKENSNVNNFLALKKVAVILLLDSFYKSNKTFVSMYLYPDNDHGTSFCSLERLTESIARVQCTPSWERNAVLSDRYHQVIIVQRHVDEVGLATNIT